MPDPEMVELPRAPSEAIETIDCGVMVTEPVKFALLLLKVKVPAPRPSALLQLDRQIHLNGCLDLHPNALLQCL